MRPRPLLLVVMAACARGGSGAIPDGSADAPGDGSGDHGAYFRVPAGAPAVDATDFVVNDPG